MEREGREREGEGGRGGRGRRREREEKGRIAVQGSHHKGAFCLDTWEGLLVGFVA